MGVPETEFSEVFWRGCKDRMGVSYFKYGRVADAFPHKVRALMLDDEIEPGSLEERLRCYRETGNTEWLMDAANFAMIEFMHPRHPSAHFAATDSDQSPGRVWKSGAVTDAANTVGHENVRLGGSNLRTDGGFYKREGD